MTTFPPVVQRRLVNGAVVLCVEDHALPMVGFVIVLRHGALLDPQGGAGLTRITLDLMLRGSEQRSRTQFNAALEEMGSSLSTATGSEAAFLRGAALRRHLDATLDLVREALIEPALTPDELTPLVDEAVAALYADRDDDDTVAELFLRRAFYRGHALARSPQGEVADLAHLTAPAVRAEHQRRLQPEGLLFAFAGDLNLDEACAHVDAITAGLPHAEGGVPSLTPPPAPSGLHVLVVDKPDRTQVQLRLAGSAVAGAHADALAFWLGSVAFGGSFTSPFTREVRDLRGWSYVAQADFDRYGVFRSPLVLRSAPALADAVACLRLELSLYAQLARGELAADTLEFARTYLLNRFPLQVASAGQLLVPAVRNELLGRAPDDFLHTPARLEALDLRQVPEVMARHLAPGEVTVVMVAAADKVLSELRAALPDATLETVNFRDGLAEGQDD